MCTVHKALIVEDDLQIAEILKELVQSLGHEWVHVTTLAEARAELESGDFCYVLLDMMIPAERGLKPFAAAGEVCLELARKRDPRKHEKGKHCLPVLIVTSYSTDPDFVWRMQELGADAFIAKPFRRPEEIFEKIRLCLERSGRGDHADCVVPPVLAPSVRPGAPVEPQKGATRGAPAEPVALVYSHELAGLSLLAPDVEALLAQRETYDLFLNHVAPTQRGYLASRRDWKGRLAERCLTVAEASVLAELMTERRPLRASGMKCVRQGGIENPVRLIERARAQVDVNVERNGKKSRTQWRAIRTVTQVGGDDTTKEFFFSPPAGMTWA
ncbi:MAG TPA: response regulator, partial [Polyangiaceae bacterium]